MTEQQTEKKTGRPDWANVGAAATVALGIGIFCIGFGPHMHQNVVAIGLLLLPLAGIGLCLAATMYLLGRR